jgi:Alw26I/Eco31I/Esp3I family type II restriction m6 adenine DNA methyltransferase
MANPPYDVYEGTKKNEIESLLIDEVFTKCKSGKLNAYELFLAKTEHFLKIDGVNIQIFQNSFLADDSAKGLRKHYLKDNKILKIDSFPERDDPSKRVFKNVKMSVCIMKSINSKTNDYTFDVFFHRDRTLNNFSYVSYSKSEISVFDSDKNIIPRLLENEKVIFKQYYLSKNNLKLDSLFNCLEGELNMTFHKGYMKTDKKLPLIVKGAQVQRYYLTDKPSQGVVQFVDKKKYLSDYSKSNKSNHHLQSRIALQGITGANDKIRIVSTLIDPMTFCANSCNYIICNPDNNKISLKTILGLINSKITNWIFRKTSTNSNVNCYEINNLRFPLGLEAFDSKISTYVSTILEKTKQGKDTFKEENEIDKILFKLYDIESDEIEKHF